MRRSADVAQLIVHRPQCANSLGPDLVEELIQAFENLHGVALVTLTDQGTSFCCGALCGSSIYCSLRTAPQL